MDVKKLMALAGERIRVMTKASLLLAFALAAGIGYGHQDMSECSRAGMINSYDMRHG